MQLVRLPDLQLRHGLLFTALYPTYFASHEVHRAMGSISFIVVLAQLLGMSLSGYVVDEWGWHAPFFG
ncbi:hypothetical protein GCM10020331_015420 [Ectobacillus funiculus]